MKSARFAVSLALVAATGVALGASACTAPQDLGVGKCDPKALFPDSWCLDASADADAGSNDAGPDGPSTAPQANACPGHCVAAPDKNQAGLWSEKPISLWVGPKTAMPSCCPGSKDCSTPGDDPKNPLDGVPNEQFRLFDKLVAPPAECDACECGASDGTCKALPEKIEIRAGLCGQNGVDSLPFDGPPGWDGSCSNESALPAGQLCNGKLCAQSVWASPLPGPTNEACAPTSVTPKVTIKQADWEIGALACSANTPDDLCNDAAKFCLNDPGLPWMFCVFREGDDEKVACPANYNSSRHVMYPQEPVDDRGCEACSCGNPAGSGCLATLHVYSDGACSSQFGENSISSFVPHCANVSVPGSAIGGKAITDLAYMPGVCAASGGAPKGNAVANVNNAVTFCCTSFFDDGELEPPK